MSSIHGTGKPNGASRPTPVKPVKSRVSFSAPITVLTIASLPQHDTAIHQICQELDRNGRLRMCQTDFYTPIFPEIAREQRILAVGGHLKVCLEGQLCSYVELAERGVRVEVLLPLDLIYRERDDFDPGKSAAALEAKLKYFKEGPNRFLTRLRDSSLSWFLLLDGQVIGSTAQKGLARVDFIARVFSDTEKLKRYLGIF